MQKNDAPLVSSSAHLPEDMDDGTDDAGAGRSGLWSKTIDRGGAGGTVGGAGGRKDKAGGGSNSAGGGSNSAEDGRSSAGGGSNSAGGGSSSAGSGRSSAGGGRSKAGGSVVWVEAGKSALLTCHVSGWPRPVVQWSREDGAPLHRTGVEQWGSGARGGEGQSKIVFRSVEESNFGRYRCTAGNSLGEAYVVITLAGESRHVYVVITLAGESRHVYVVTLAGESRHVYVVVTLAVEG
ncbi:hypothetical protein HAZT_HAZT005649 [Hyalella azteca]|uniref:Ig-like domain-containing protein n=1 Tax=Hyalella azteca TaxID=294128 RepID=A0A6A0H8X4_HYAAZ|nr:hypothetical protein HAZT_HAZT005649 [Hyalella azteca]